nr:hypothetical protein [Tanacetum cinerariifolium]
TDLVGSLGTDLDGSSGTDLVGSSGTDLDGSSGTDLVGSLRTDLDGSLGTDLDGSLWNRSSMALRLSNVEITSLLIMNVFVVQMSLPIIVKNTRTMATTIEQQVVLDEALIPSTQREMLHIYPRIPGQAFAELPFEEEILEFIWFLRHGATIRTLTDININKLYQPWRSFTAIINKCLTGNSFGYDIEHKNQTKSNEMYYPRFTKVIIHHFMSKEPSIPRRNKINWHYVRDDSIFSTIKVVSKHQNTQQYDAMLPIELTNDEIRNTKAYKEYYAFATGEAAPKPKASAKRKRSGSDTSITPPTATTTPTTIVTVTLRLTAAGKGKQPAKAKSPSNPSEVARTEAQQLKIVLRRSRQQTHISQLGGYGTYKGTGSKPRVTDESEEELSWNSSDDEDADDQEKDGDDDEGDEGNDSEDGEEDDDDDEDKKGDERDDDDQDQEVAKHDDKDDTEESGDVDEEGESDEEDDNEETRDEESFDPIPQTPKSSEDESDGEEDQGLRIGEEERLNEEEEAEELYRDSSSVSSHFVTSMLNPPSNAGLESIFAAASSPVAPLQTSTPIMTPSTIATITTISQAPIPPTIIPSEVLQNLPTFDSVFRFEDRLNSLEANFSEYIQTNPFAEAVSNIPGIVHQYMNQQMTEAVSASKSAFAEEPVQTTSQMDEPSYPVFETAVQGSTQTWISELAKQADSRSSFNELLDTPLVFSNFIMNQLRVDTLTPELLAGPTFELMKGSCTSLIELEYHLEEVYKATTDQLDWVNPEDYENIKWIEYLVPRTMWIQEPINYDKHALWGVSHWGRKRQQFYGFAVNRESALDVYSKRRIIAIMDLKIVEWHSYKHLDWIT